MSARSRQLGAIRSTAATTYHVLGTVPAGKRWVIKSWSAYSVPGGDCILSFLRGADVWIMERSTLAPTGSLSPRGALSWFVLEPADVLRVWSSVAGMTIVVHGMELDL